MCVFFNCTATVCYVTGHITVYVIHLVEHTMALGLQDCKNTDVMLMKEQKALSR